METSGWRWSGPFAMATLSSPERALQIRDPALSAQFGAGMALKVPLTQPQVSAAVKIRRQLTTWMAADAALELLADRVPGFTLPATTLKVAAINQLYGTNLYAVSRMATHIT